MCKRLSLQYDILFDVLSAREHMRIYAALKGVSTPEQGVPSARARRCGLARGCTREYRLTHAQVRLESVKAEVDAKIALLDLAAFADKEVRSALALIVLRNRDEAQRAVLGGRGTCNGRPDLPSQSPTRLIVRRSARSAAARSARSRSRARSSVRSRAHSNAQSRRRCGQGRAQSWCRCGSGEPSPSVDM